MLADEALEIIASYLRPDEAGMLRGLLESEGIPATIRDEAFSSVNPHLRSAIGGAKLVVPARHATRAREIIASTGVIPGEEPRVLYELPEEEWSRPWSERPARLTYDVPEPPADGRGALADRALLAAVVGTALVFPVLHLYSLWTIGRFFAVPGRAARTVRSRAVAAVLLDSAALVAASSLAIHLLRR